MNRIFSFIAGLAICIALLARGVTQEVPLGSVQGVALMAENDRPLKGVLITLSLDTTLPEEQTYTRSLVTDAEGKFSLAQVPAGDYTIIASAKAHKLSEKTITIEEGKRKDLELSLQPIPPYLDLLANQHVFTPNEKSSIELHGFSSSSSIQVDLYRIDKKKAFTKTSLESLLSPISRRYSSNVAKPESVGSLVSTTRYDIKNRDAEGVFIETVTNPKLTEGIYWIQCTVGGDVQATYLNVTQMALVTKNAGRDVLCYTTRIDTGVPIAGASVGHVSPTGFVEKAKTDKDGVARFTLPEGSGDQEGVVACWNQSYAITDFYSESDSPEKYRMYVYSDRPVYRPGDKVHFKGLIRKIQGNNYAQANQKQALVEFRTPDESLLESKMVPINDQGTFNASFKLNKEAETGGYMIVAIVDGQKYSRGIPVEAYRKPEFNIVVKPDKPYYVRGDKGTVRVKCDYYFGAPVVDATVSCTINRQPYWSYDEMSEYDNGSEGDYEGSEDSEQGYGGGEFVRDYNAKTNDRGEAVIDFDTIEKNDPKTAEQDYIYTVEVSVRDSSDKYFDGSGSVKIVRGDFDLKLSTSSYVAEPNKPITATVTCRTHESNKPVVGVKVALRTDYESWVNNKRSTYDTARYSGVTDKNGVANIEIVPTRAGSLSLRASARDDRDNEISGTDWIWVEGESNLQNAPKATELSVRLDKKSYSVGSTAKALIQTDAPGGSALVTIEADKIHFTRVIALNGPVTVVDLPVTQQEMPNAFVSVSYVHGKTFTQSTKRLVVDLGEKNLSVSIKPDKTVYEPGDVAKVVIETLNDKGKPQSAELSLGVVDESIYSIAQDRTNIHEAFYPKRRNRVVTQHSFTELYLDGGDKGAPDVKIRSDFRDTAFWMPTVVTDANGRAEVEVKLPDNLTEWRLTAVGITSDTAVGMTTCKFKARKPLMIRLQGPAFLVSQDKQRIVAQVLNDTGQDATVNVNIDAKGVGMEGDRSQQIRIASGGQESLQWDINATDAGTGVITAKAWIANGRSDGVELRIPIKPHGRTVQQLFAGDLKDRAVFDFTVHDQADPSSTSLKLSITPNAAIALYQCLGDLLDYPYGCVEQTMSRFMPAVVVAQIGKANNLPQLPRQKEIPLFVADGYARLQRMQHSDGGWGWWENDASDPLMTAYVLEGCYIASKAGYKPKNLKIDNALEWAEGQLKEKGSDPQGDSYLAYALTLYGRNAEAATALGKLAKDTSDPRIFAYRVMAYANMGAAYSKQKATALQQLVNGIQGNQSRAWWTEEDYADETNSRCLQALATVQPDNPSIPAIARNLMLKRKGMMWDSTLGTTYAVLGLSKTIRAVGAASDQGQIVLNVNGKVYQTFKLDRSAMTIKGLVAEIPLDHLNKGSNSIVLLKTGPGLAYYSATFNQTINRKVLGDVVSDSDLRISRKYFRMELQPLENGRLRYLPSKTPITEFQKGDIVQCEVTVTSNQERSYMMIEDPIPAGFRVNLNLANNEDGEWGYWFAEMDVRDDRVATFVTNLSAGTNKLTYMMRAESPGLSHALPAQIYDMYDPKDRASCGEMVVEVNR
jgi:uncharacterized protein YfaS (alpha-2-macroglobulin family)